ncbi:hypothetical protein Q5752_003808 [Cryptotrichosporon argae]
MAHHLARGQPASQSTATSASFTEYDSPDIDVDGDIAIDIESPAHVAYAYPTPEPKSPSTLDPSSSSDEDEPGTGEAGSPYFRVPLYLDRSPLDLTPQVTRPLRVKKHAVGRRRPSVLSVPHSPRSPRLPHSPRSPRTPPRTRSRSSTILSTLSCPPITIQPLYSVPPSAPSGPTRPLPSHLALPATDGRHRSTSELHLGLGRFESYADYAVPRPSPPASPASSPSRGAFADSASAAAAAVFAVAKTKPLPLPPSPLTPSRAPRKAAAVLGASAARAPGSNKSTPKAPSSYTYAGSNYDYAPACPIRSKPIAERDAFRPLPSSKLVEIKQFFGSSPAPRHTKPRTAGPSSSSSASSSAARRKVEPSARAGTEPHYLGEGATVRHTGADGRMWIDVEEEQEFAWLMSEVFALPAPVARSRAETEDTGIDVDVDADNWGMDIFTSVLNVKRNEAAQHGPHPWSAGSASPKPQPQPKPKRRPPPLKLHTSPPGNLPVSAALSPTLRPLPARTVSLPKLSLALPKPSLPIPSLVKPSFKRAHTHTQAPEPEPELELLATPLELKHISYVAPPGTPSAHPRVAPGVPVPHPSAPASAPAPTAPAQLVVPARRDVSFFEPVTPVGALKVEGSRWLRKVKELKI